MALISSSFTFCGTTLTTILASPLINSLFEKPPATQEIKLQGDNGTTETSEIALIGEKHLITSQDLKRLDLNEFYVDQNLEIAVKKAASNLWEINTYDRLPVISMMDVPTYGLSFSMFGSLYTSQQPLTIFGVRQQTGHEILLDEDSMISSIPMNLNLYDNIEFVKASIQAQADMISRLNPQQGEIYKQLLEDDATMSKLQEELSNSFNAYIQTQLPLIKRVHSGVYVISINKDNLKNDFSAGLLPESSLLDRTMNYLTLSGLYGAGTLQNIIINQENGIASFNSSVELGDVKIDGKKTDATLNNIGFIVAGEERALLVVLVYLDTDNLSVLNELKGILDSLRFTR